MDWQSLLTTFGLVFIAELGDKTQLAVVAQTCKFRSTWPVFIGGSLALTTVTALGAVGGKLIGAVIPQEVIRYLAAFAFVVMGVLIFREAQKSANAMDSCEFDDSCADEKQSRWNWKAFGSTFGLLFFAELGDKTQLSVLGLASKMPSVWIVFAGGAAALTAVTAIGVLGGEQLCRIIPEHVLLRISSVAFVLLGILMALGIL